MVAFSLPVQKADAMYFGTVKAKGVIIEDENGNPIGAECLICDENGVCTVVSCNEPERE